LRTQADGRPDRCGLFVPGGAGEDLVNLGVRFPPGALARATVSGVRRAARRRVGGYNAERGIIDRRTADRGMQRPRCGTTES